LLPKASFLFREGNEQGEESMANKKVDDLQHSFQRLESLHPNRGFTIQQLQIMVGDAEINLYKTLGDLEEWGTPAIVSAFVKALSKDPDSKIRGQLAASLGEIAHMIVNEKVKQ
jgi:hypothetical protein